MQEIRQFQLRSNVNDDDDKYDPDVIHHYRVRFFFLLISNVFSLSTYIINSQNQKS